MNFATLIALVAGVVTFALLFLVTCVTGIAMFWGNTSLWPLLYVLGVPLVGALLVVRRLR